MHVHSPHMHSHMDTHTVTNVWMECWGKLMPPILLKKRTQFLYLTAKQQVFPETNEEHMDFLSLFHVFTQPVFPDPLCARPYAQCCGGRYKLGLSPASQEHPMLLGRGGP